MTIEKEVHETLRRAKLSVPELADRLGVQEFYLYKMSNPADNGADFKLKLAVPLMRATKDYRILKRLNQACGYLPPVRMPRAPRDKTEDGALVSAYQKTCHDAVDALIGYMDDPANTDRQAALQEALRDVMSHSAGIHKRVDHAAQLDLGL